MSSLAIDDLKEGLKSWPVWSAFGWHDVQQRYRRSVLGPLWITLSLGVTVTGMGFLFGSLFKQPLQDFLPYLALGMVFWSFISTVVTDACLMFSSQDGLIRQLRLPYSFHLARMIWRNLIILAHNAIVVVAVLLIFQKVPHWHIIFFPLILSLVLLLGSAVSMLLAIVCVRFRDVPQIVASVMQILFFITPVVWMKASLQNHEWVVFANPLNHVLEVLRAPFLGQPVPLESLLYTSVITVAALVLSFAVFAEKRRMIAYWV